MDRKAQLSNVAFGGAWSERIPRNEHLARCVEMVSAAGPRTVEEDLREDDALSEAVDYICQKHPKGQELARSWRRALCEPHPGVRQGEVLRLARAITAWSPQNT